MPLQQRVQALCGQRPLLFYVADASLFTSNLKAFYLFLQRAGGLSCLLSHDWNLVRALQQAGLSAERVDSNEAQPWLASSQWLLVSSAACTDELDPHWLQGKRVMQLGQGSPVKRCGLLELTGPACPPERQQWLEAHAGVFSAVVAASDWFARILTLAWQPQVTFKTGLPRTDILLRPADALDLLNVPVDMAQLQQLHQESRIALYLPTRRSSLPSPLTDPELDWVAFNEVLQAGNCVMLVKAHPAEAAASDALRAMALSHILVLDAAGDVYPLLPMVDVLISDYSSVMFDFLLLDRPQLFFVPDLQQYQQQECGFVFDLPLMAPGPLCGTLHDLALGLQSLWQGEDTFALERSQVNAIANDFAAGGACERLLDDLLELARLQEAA